MIKAIEMVYAILEFIVNQVSKRDKGYQLVSQHHDLSYRDFKRYEKEWSELEQKYGDWSTAWKHEPIECARLEHLLA